MAPSALKRFATGLGPVVGLALIMLASLKLMSDATENSATFGELYSWLLLVNVIGLVVLAGLIAGNLYRLLTQLRQRVAGARLTARMVVMFVVLAVTPVLLVYYFSVQFLHRGIDSWFDVRVEQALNNALELSRTALGVRMRDLRRDLVALAWEVTQPFDRNVIERKNFEHDPVPVLFARLALHYYPLVFSKCAMNSISVSTASSLTAL